MALVLDDLVRVDYRGQCYGQRIILTTCYRVTTAFTAGGTVNADLALILNAVGIGGTGLQAESYMACLQNAYSLLEIRAQLVNPTRSAYRSIFYTEENTGGAGVGTVANDSAAVTFRGPLAKRSNVATKHIGPVPDSASANGLLTNAYKSLLNTFIDKMNDNVSPISNPGVLTPVIQTAAAPFYANIIDARIGDQSRVQRRRTVGLGE